MSYVKTKKLITASGRKRILAVGYETRELGLKAGDTVIAYLARPEDELEIDTILSGTGKQYYIVFSDTTDIIAADTLAHAEKIAKGSYPDCIVIGGLDSRAQAVRIRDRLIEENVPRDRLQRRLEELIP